MRPYRRMRPVPCAVQQRRRQEITQWFAYRHGTVANTDCLAIDRDRSARRPVDDARAHSRLNHSSGDYHGNIG